MEPRVAWAVGVPLADNALVLGNSATPKVRAIGYLLHLADNALASWASAMPNGAAMGRFSKRTSPQSNVSLDLIGQARLLYQLAAGRQGGGATEDTLAYFRDVPDFRNYTLLELPHHGPLAGTAAAPRDYATTIVRNFLYSALMVLVWDALQKSPDAQLAAIAAKSLKEVRYHLRHARDWLVRLGDGTGESHARTQAALDHLLPYTQEFWTPRALPNQAAQPPTAQARLASLRGRVGLDTLVDEALAEATLTARPPTATSRRASTACIPSTWASCWPKCRAWRARIRRPPGNLQDMNASRADAWRR